VHGHLSWLVELDIKDGKLEEATTLMSEMVEHTAREDTTHSYDWYISEDNTKASIYEGYDSPDSAHSHLKGFLETFVDRFVDDLKADLEGWSPTYLRHWGGFRRDKST
jgi:quinol monooxygenase YgiN